MINGRQGQRELNVRDMLRLQNGLVPHYSLRKNNRRLKVQQKSLRFEMKTYTRYSEDFNDQALAKVYSRRNDQSIKDVADDVHICLQTLQKWTKKSK